MKKFITVVPLQIQNELKKYCYIAVGNSKLQMETETSFPIMTAINGYVQPGEPFRLLAIVAESDDGRRNLAALQGELDALCAKNNIFCPAGIEIIPAPTDERVASHVGVFRTLLDYVEDDDELFVCITYGTKPLSQALMLATQYAYRVKSNASISCIVYGQIDRSGGRNPECWTGYIYDETALVQLGEIVRMLADQGNTNIMPVINSILSL